MTQRLSPVEFFAMEASDYLERLDVLVSPPSPPDTEEFVRLARALRGSAIMAKQNPIAQAATALERFARAVKDGRRPWNEATKQIAVRAVDDLKILVRQIPKWSPEDSEKARRLAGDLDPDAGAPRRSGAFAAEAGERSFIGREAAALAATLESAAKALQKAPEDSASPRQVADAVLPFRGVATLAEFPPLLELLQGIEQASVDASRGAVPGRAAALVYHAGARALRRVAQDVAGTGATDPAASEIHDFVQRLRDLLADEGQTVPIDSLFFGDGGPHVVEEGTPPDVAAMGVVEVVSHGEHLREVADQLESARSSTQLELRALSLGKTFRALERAEGAPLLAAVSAFATAARQAVVRGCATHHRADFAQQMRDASGVLTRAATEDEMKLAGRLREIVTTLDDLPGAPPPGLAPAPMIEPRRAAAPAEPPTPGAPVAATAFAADSAASPDDGGPLVASWTTFERLMAEPGDTRASFDEFLSGAGVSAGSAASPASVVPISDLCYSGPAALERALGLERQVRTVLTRDAGAPEISQLLDEIFDLVRLGTAK
jgi:hypothetical protein